MLLRSEVIVGPPCVGGASENVTAHITDSLTARGRQVFKVPASVVCEEEKRDMAEGSVECSSRDKHGILNEEDCLWEN